MTSLVVLQKGIYDTLTTCGPFSPQQVSGCDYGILQGVSGCAIVFHFIEANVNPIVFRGKTTRALQYGIVKFEGECFIQYTGDTTTFLAAVPQLADDLGNTFDKDQTLQGSACNAWADKFTFNIDEGYDMGGKEYGVVRFRINIQDMD